MTPNPKPERPRDMTNDILDAVETATRKWTRQKKSEERQKKPTIAEAARWADDVDGCVGESCRDAAYAID
jgi:hypothetical protein